VMRVKQGGGRITTTAHLVFRLSRISSERIDGWINNMVGVRQMKVGELIPGMVYRMDRPKEIGYALGDNWICFSYPAGGRFTHKFNSKTSCPEPTFFIPPELV